MIETIQWTESGVVMIDQTKLPRQEVYVTCSNYQEVAEAIRSMVIRGAPAIGVAAAMGIALGMRDAETEQEFEQICKTLAAKPSGSGSKISRSMSASGVTAPHSCRMARPCSHTAMLGRWQRPAMAQRWELSGRQWRSARRSMSSPAKPDPFCKALASPYGNCSTTIFRQR
jgi:hypothetical protein